MIKLLVVFAGGGIGSLVRYLISLTTNKLPMFGFPLATFIANLLSCLLMLLILKAYKEGIMDENHRLFLIVGFLGGLSTFSTFSYETSLLMKEGHHMMAFSNVGLSVSVCVYCLFKLT